MAKAVLGRISRTYAGHENFAGALKTLNVEAASLAADLHAVIAGEVRFDAGSRALYATDGSNYRQTPIGVVIPRSKQDIIATVAAARRHGAPILARGGGTSLAGQCCNVAVLMDLTKYLHHGLEVDRPHPRRERELGGLGGFRRRP